MDLFVRKILQESKSASYPDVSNFDKMPDLGSGAEGTIKDYGNIAIKKFDKVSLNKKAMSRFINLIKNPQDDFIKFFDIWKYNGEIYLSMQKLTQQQLDQPEKDYESLNDDGEIYFSIADLEMDPTNEDILKSLQPYMQNPFVAFCVKMTQNNFNDLKAENMAVVDGKYKLFDWY